VRRGGDCSSALGGLALKCFSLIFGRESTFWRDKLFYFFGSTWYTSPFVKIWNDFFPQAELYLIRIALWLCIVTSANTKAPKHTDIHTHTHTRTHTRTHAHIHTHSLCLSLSFSPFLSLFLSFSLSYNVSLSLSLSLSRARALSLSLAGSLASLSGTRDGIVRTRSIAK